MTANCKGPVATVCLSHYAGGMERDAMSIARNMAGLASHSVLIVRAKTWLARKAEAQGLNVESVAMTGNINPWAALRLRRLWRRYDIRNLVYLGSSEMPTLFLSLLGFDRNFLVRHGTTKRRSKKDLIHQLTWSKVNAHWCISHHIQRNVEAVFPVMGTKTFVAYTSQSHKIPYIPRADLPRLGHQPIKLVHVGRLQPDKGQRDAIKVLKKLKDSDVESNLTLFGQGTDRDYLERMIAAYNLSDSVFFMGDIDEPYRQFHKFNAFIFPSSGEGLPNALVEAIFSGMPCFVYNNTVFPEFSCAGFDIEVCPDQDLDFMAAAVIEKFRSAGPSLNERNIELAHETFSRAAETSAVSQYLE